MITAQSEQIKYERMHQVPGYSAGPGASYVPCLLNYLEKGDSVIDFGCGSGEAGRLLAHLQYKVLNVDITNAVRYSGVPFIRASLHELPDDLPKATWGFCTDVMEHLPEEWVAPALNGMRGRVKSIFFSISGVPDGWGKHIGERLHLTVKPVEWWIERISKHWKQVERLNKSDCAFEIVGRG